MSGDNEGQRSDWTDVGRGWVAQEAVFDAAFAPVTEAILTAAGLTAGNRVLDVGCGSGTLLAAATAAGAEAVGVDISPTMVEAARRRVPGATVVLADAQDSDLLEVAPGRPFDRVVSRFGVMFFADPVAAFSRIRGAAADDARLVLVCWRTREENPIFTLGTDVLTRRLPPAGPEPVDAPGPTTFADPTRLRTVLSAAGWAPTVAPLDFVCDYAGADPTGHGDGVEERLAVVLATSTGARARAVLEPELGPDGWAALVEEVRADLLSHLDDRGGLRIPGAAWLVTATPG
ncbi:methyltransferase domain-containing protein [Nocardioides dongxiaopingii]|uniref:class I SAM-dependent methyltransferase n=1 Tax=Nocardioides sp. S-1144 TaxID=2582905 RepID=UPI00110F1C6E|nr:class I SAM-dependent methyltransferase [Nocardioides sp. S-1144]QCW49600.1 methyltransferase domain-containing protein [Nocardioides sp. S-1144]